MQLDGYSGTPGSARVLIVDDEEVLRQMLHEVLSSEYALAASETAEQALDFIHQYSADVVLVDKNLPGLTGLDLLKQIKSQSPDIEVIVITGYASLESALEALRLGAYDYLLKPFDDISIVSEKVHRAIEKRELAKERRGLLEQLLLSNEELRSTQNFMRRSYLETLTSMITALEARDAYTRGHSDRVAEFSVAIGREMKLGPDRMERLRDGARLHDLGKIGVREQILNKAGRLTEEEFDHIKEHPVIGAQIIGKMENYRQLLPMIRNHHERWDGKGYPDGLSGDEIPLEARIVAVADCYDAMTSKRPYRTPSEFDSAINILKEVSGSQLDPAVVGAFLIAVQRGSIVPQKKT